MSRDECVGSVTGGREGGLAGPPLVGITWLEVDGEARVYRPGEEGLLRLNASATAVWRLLDGRPVADVVRAVAEEHELDPDAVRPGVEDALRSFVAAGLIPRST